MRRILAVYEGATAGPVGMTAFHQDGLRASRAGSSVDQATHGNAGVTPLELVIRRKRMLTGDICEFELQHPGAEPLPAFDPGAHLNVETPSGAVRSYSLTNDPVETHRYVIAVKREDRGRGGSASMVNDAAEGAPVRVSRPSNSFPLFDASKRLFVAGGIGITPILSMMRCLIRRGDGDFCLIYCTRSAADAAYLPELSAPAFTDRVIVHHDEGNRESAFDFWPFLMVPDDTHVYCCGPAQLMEHIRALTVHWPPGAIHFEDFAGVSAVGGTSRPFRVKRSSSGEFFDVPADKTILEVLRDGGVDLPSSCESGTCGTCRMKLVTGDVEHRDLILSDAERREAVMPCVSRAAGSEIELDF